MGMESAQEIMAKMGFRTEASEAVKIAFIKNMIKHTYGVEVRTPLQLKSTPQIHPPPLEIQLSFNFDSDLKVG